jgi:hypothetical protein
VSARNYTTVERGIGVLADGGTPYSDANLLWVPPRLNISGLVGQDAKRFAFAFARITNRSGGAAIAGIGARVHRAYWQAGQLSAAGALTLDTVDAQSAANDDFPLEVATAGGNNSGFLVACADQFNLLAVRVTTAAVGAGAVRVIEYPVAGGTWATLSNPLVNVPQGSWAAGVALLWWFRPNNQAPLEAGHIASGDTSIVGKEGIRVRATTAPATTAAVAGSLSVCQVVMGNLSLADDTAFEMNPAWSEHQLNGRFDGMVGVLSNVGAIQSQFHVNARLLG